ncbi:hypothetical protein Nepgr_028308 [Nepenthes gracilis]|uniref:Uncharacterized protein n=1 Tax=Nepenthes gracilis TaxID=150966 RepID=A0AAD3TA30_NEPGR|nr:hypothetical protein Nepgr_028308 [Nepenthes gracilis]
MPPFRQIALFRKNSKPVINTNLATQLKKRKIVAPRTSYSTSFISAAPCLSQYSSGLFCLKSPWSSWERTFNVFGTWLASKFHPARKEKERLLDLYFPERDWNMHH